MYSYLCRNPNAQEEGRIAVQGRQNRKKGSSALVRIVVLCLIAYFVLSFLQAWGEIAEKQAFVSELDTLIEEQTVINDALRDQLENGVSDEYIASVAREKLGYALPGERIFIDSSSK